jgi:hypothetical protein
VKLSCLACWENDPTDDDGIRYGLRLTLHCLVKVGPDAGESYGADLAANLQIHRSICKDLGDLIRISDRKLRVLRLLLHANAPGRIKPPNLNAKSFSREASIFVRAGVHDCSAPNYAAGR